MQMGARATYCRVIGNQLAHLGPTQTASHLGILQFACNKLQQEAVASLMCWGGWNWSPRRRGAQTEQRHIVLPLTGRRNGNNAQLLNLFLAESMNTDRKASAWRPRLACSLTNKKYKHNWQQPRHLLPQLLKQEKSFQREIWKWNCSMKQPQKVFTFLCVFIQIPQLSDPGLSI